MRPSEAYPQEKSVPGPDPVRGRALVPDGRAPTSPSADELRTSRVAVFVSLSLCLLALVLLFVLAFVWIIWSILTGLF